MTNAAPAAHEVFIDAWHPVTLNQLVGHHRMVAAKKKRIDRDLIYVYCARAGVTTATTKRRVQLVLYLGPRQRGADPDAYWKSLLDALVHCKALKDDSNNWVELAPVKFIKAKQKGTLIILEDI